MEDFKKGMRRFMQGYVFEDSSILEGIFGKLTG
jgi:hypothetical protein